MKRKTTSLPTEISWTCKKKRTRSKACREMSAEGIVSSAVTSEGLNLLEISTVDTKPNGAENLKKSESGKEDTYCRKIPKRAQRPLYKMDSVNHIETTFDGITLEAILEQHNLTTALQRVVENGGAPALTVWMSLS